jgi:arylsulfatase A-like enzyme
VDREPERAAAELSANIVLVTLDTTRADHLHAYGYFRDTSPVFDALARESILFDSLIAPISMTLPSHLSLLTATHPLEHGVYANATRGRRVPPPAALRSLASFSREAGYRTAAFVSAAPLKSGGGTERGFDVYSEPRKSHRPGNETTDAALAWLRSQPKEAPYLLWVHYYDAHTPFMPLPPPDGHRGRYESSPLQLAHLREREIPSDAAQARRIDRYDEEIRFADQQLGRLVDTLRARSDWGRTVLVVAGDHGEALGQHGFSTHGGLFEEQLRAPLLMRIPGEPPRRVSSPLGMRDVLPTLFDLIDFPNSTSLLSQASGRSVLTPNEHDGVLVSQTGGSINSGEDSIQYSLRTWPWKLYWQAMPAGPSKLRMYSLESDPYELRDVGAAEPEIAQELSALLRERIAKLRSRGDALRVRDPARSSRLGSGFDSDAGLPADPDKEARNRRLVEELRSLGYVIEETGRPGPDQKSQR